MVGKIISSVNDFDTVSDKAKLIGGRMDHKGVISYLANDTLFFKNKKILDKYKKFFDINEEDILVEQQFADGSFIFEFEIDLFNFKQRKDIITEKNIKKELIAETKMLAEIKRKREEKKNVKS